ncbi:MAG: MFS transporter [Bacilli bacterium]|nr:MFS transporter [Bacilli bacterium]MBN2696915.1 MFS transporter [Bacilli bacterium]
MFSESFKFKLFYFIRFFGDAFFYPFMSIYFVAKGVSEADLGIILAITPITAILVNPAWNFMAKDIRMIRIILKVMTLVEGVLIIVLTQVSGIEMYMLIIALIAFFCSPFISIQDGFAATFSNNNKIEYSSLRIYASIAYVIASGLAGFLVQYVGYTALFIVSGSFFMLTTLVVFWLKPFSDNLQVSERTKRDFRSLLKNTDFYKYLLFYMIVIGIVRVGDSFFGVYMVEEMKMSTAGYGLLYSAFVFVEVLTLRFLITKAQLVDERKLLLLGTLLFLIRFLAYGLNLPLPAIYAITLLRGVAFGLIIFAHIRQIIKIVKVENVTMAILIFTLFLSAFTALGSFFFGKLVEDTGYSILYLAIAGLIVVGLISFVVLAPKKQKEIIAEN